MHAHTNTIWVTGFLLLQEIQVTVLYTPVGAIQYFNNFQLAIRAYCFNEVHGHWDWYNAQMDFVLDMFQIGHVPSWLDRITSRVLWLSVQEHGS